MSIIHNIYKYFTDEDYRFLVNRAHGLTNKMDDEKYLCRLFKAKMGYKLDLNNPVTYNEKLQWLKLHDRKPIYTTMVDKYEAKDYIANIVGKEYVVPTLGIWDRFDDIDFDKLPNQFVLKTTHDSGGVVLCKNKNEFDFARAKELLNKSLKKEYYFIFREWPYLGVKPRILAEQFLQENNDEGWLTDYKFFCFNGVPQIVYVSKDKAKDPKTDFFDMEYNHLPIMMQDPPSEVLPHKPECFEQMKEMASKLSAGLPHLRVDFYYVDNKLYIGELTFYHCGGFALVKPAEWNRKLGEFINMNFQD